MRCDENHQPQPRTCTNEDTPMRRMIGKIVRRISFRTLCRAIISLMLVKQVASLLV
jgi:hypothetical protein